MNGSAPDDFAHMAQPPRRRVRGHRVFGLYMRIIETLATNALGTDKRTTVK